MKTEMDINPMLTKIILALLAVTIVLLVTVANSHQPTVILFEEVVVIDKIQDTYESRGLFTTSQNAQYFICYSNGDSNRVDIGQYMATSVGDIHYKEVIDDGLILTRYHRSDPRESENYKWYYYLDIRMKIAK